MAKKILIRDLTLRDGQQSQFATRMSQNQVDRVLPYYKQAKFYAMEVWGGAVPDSIMRYLNENPWDRLEKIKAGIGDASHLTALSRGRNLFGYNPYPDDVIEGFNRNAVKSGISIMRIFDALNDLSNMASTIKFVKENGGLTDCAVCYTVDSQFTAEERKKAEKAGVKLPENLFNVQYFVDKAVELEKMGADMISIKDMAGLVHPEASGQLIRALKKVLKVPVDLHTHCTPGFGLGSVLMAMVNGADIIDAVLMPFAGGPAAPAFELIQVFANKIGLDTGVDLDAVAKISEELYEIKKELAPFDQYKMIPLKFNPAKDKLPKDIEKLFDEALNAANKEDIPTVIKTTQAIERYFNFPEPDEIVRIAQIPGGMYTNMLAQLQQANLEHLLETVLDIVPMVRIDAGCPPLVTPTSQIVGVQAVNCVVDYNNGKPFYTTNSIQFVNLVKGLYGKTPYPVDPQFRLEIAGTKDETPYDTSKHKKEENPSLPELGGELLAQNEKDALLLELFPAVAKGFLKAANQKKYHQRLINQQIEAQNAIDNAQSHILEGLRQSPLDA